MEPALGAWNLGSCNPAFYCPQPPQGGYFSVHFWPSDTLVPTQTPSPNTWFVSVAALCLELQLGCITGAGSPVFYHHILSLLGVWVQGLSGQMHASWAPRVGQHNLFSLEMTAPQHSISGRCLCRSPSFIPDPDNCIWGWRLRSWGIIHPQCIGFLQHFPFYSGPANYVASPWLWGGIRLSSWFQIRS